LIPYFIIDALEASTLKQFPSKKKKTYSYFIISQNEKFIDITRFVE